MNALGLAGLPATMNGFKSKADALKFAIEFTATSDSSFQRFPLYQAAQELFDFICKNVNLPDVEPDKAADFLDYAKTALQMQLDKNEKPKATASNDTPQALPENIDYFKSIYSFAKRLGFQGVSGEGGGKFDRRSETLQLRKDDYEYTVKIDRRKITF